MKSARRTFRSGYATSAYCPSLVYARCASRRSGTPSAFSSRIVPDFRFLHRISAPLDRVVSALLRHGSVEQLPTFVPEVLEAHEIERTVTPDGIRRESLVVARSALPLASRFLPDGRLSWREIVDWNSLSNTGTFRVQVVARPVLARRMDCRGIYTLTALQNGCSVRVIEGTLSIRAPLFGEAVAHTVISRLETYFDGEARMLESLS